MGCYSWIYSDTKKPMLIGGPGILVLPNGGILESTRYAGYGVLGGKDIYELVADWNRPYLSEHPEHILPNAKKAVSEYFWYTVYSDQLIPIDRVAEKLKEKNKQLPACYELREIGINLACGDADNRSLPFPIKICRYKENADYEKLSPSVSDPGQGL